MKPLLFMLKINFKKKTTLNYRTGRAPTSTEALDRSYDSSVLDAEKMCELGSM